MTTSETIQRARIAILASTTNRSSSRARGTTIRATKPLLTSMGYLSSKLATRAWNASRYSPSW